MFVTESVVCYSNNEAFNTERLVYGKFIFV